MKMKLRSERHFPVESREQKQPLNFPKGDSIVKTWNKWRLNSVATGTFFLGR